MDYKPYIHSCIPLSLHIDSQKAMLKNDMDRAARHEDYEKCIKIRDKIKEL